MRKSGGLLAAGKISAGAVGRAAVAAVTAEAAAASGWRDPRVARGSDVVQREGGRGGSDGGRGGRRPQLEGEREGQRDSGCSGDPRYMAKVQERQQGLAAVAVRRGGAKN